MLIKIREDFDGWVKKQFNVTSQDFSQIGNVILANVKMVPDNGKEPVEYLQPTKFDVWSNADGTVFKLRDTSFLSNQGSGQADFPNVTASPQAGREYTLTKKEYEKLLLFPDPAGGGPGMM